MTRGSAWEVLRRRGLRGGPGHTGLDRDVDADFDADADIDADFDSDACFLTDTTAEDILMVVLLLLPRGEMKHLLVVPKNRSEPSESMIILFSHSLSHFHGSPGTIFGRTLALTCSVIDLNNL